LGLFSDYRMFLVPLFLLLRSAYDSSLAKKGKGPSSKTLELLKDALGDKYKRFGRKIAKGKSDAAEEGETVEIKKTKKTLQHEEEVVDEEISELDDIGISIGGKAMEVCYISF